MPITDERGSLLLELTRLLVTRGQAAGLELRSDDLNPILKFCAENDFRQLIVSVEATPAFLRGLGELEDRR